MFNSLSTEVLFNDVCTLSEGGIYVAALIRARAQNI